VPKAQLYLVKLDLSEFDSVREFGEHLRQHYGKASLDLLVNNAGIMALPKRTTNSQGLELQISVAAGMSARSTRSRYSGAGTFQDHLLIATNCI
jgi:NAD(P)-dependent dehydrogenase (short-subunit alcohol dehydrogenase family)